MATDFAVFLHRFLTSHLAGLRGCSPNTIASYRDTFKLLIAWFRDHRSIPPDKLTLDLIDAAAVTELADNPHATIIQADIRDPDAILDHPTPRHCSTSASRSGR
jgi:hypothetical protein